jgi:histidinol phosphatase-like PHP family hydrolase
MFRIAKDAGCKFYLGSDAHTPDEFKQIKEIFDYAIEVLRLKEDDKFRIEGI